MLNFDLIKNILIIAIASGVVCTLLVQKIKEGIKVSNSKIMIAISFVINMVVGTLFAICFSNTNLIYSLWVGFFSFIDADLIYRALEDKVFAPFSKLKKQLKKKQRIQ